MEARLEVWHPQCLKSKVNCRSVLQRCPYQLYASDGVLVALTQEALASLYRQIFERVEPLENLVKHQLSLV